MALIEKIYAIQLPVYFVLPYVSFRSMGSSVLVACILIWRLAFDKDDRSFVLNAFSIFNVLRQRRVDMATPVCNADSI
jgi:hypothetical protein